MGLASFLSALFAGGRVRVNAEALLTADDLEQSQSLLLAFERDRRDELPGTPPAFARDAAQYGAETMYRACQFLVFREVEPETIHELLGRPWRSERSASVHYSVDLTLRFLPDLVRLARRISAEDPLVTDLIQLAGRWPLSAVGISGADAGDVEPIVSDPCLVRLYLDRIIARHDFQRLANVRVREAARQAIGAFSELSPAAAAALSEREIA